MDRLADSISLFSLINAYYNPLGVENDRKIDVCKQINGPRDWTR